MRLSMAQPTIRFEYRSLMAQQYSLPSAVQCSVRSVTHTTFGALAVKSLRTRSSWAGAPGRDPLPRLGLPNLDHHWLSRQIRHTTRSDTS